MPNLTLQVPDLNALVNDIVQREANCQQAYRTLETAQTDYQCAKDRLADAQHNFDQAVLVIRGAAPAASAPVPVPAPAETPPSTEPEEAAAADDLSHLVDANLLPPDPEDDDREEGIMDRPDI